MGLPEIPKKSFIVVDIRQPEGLPEKASLESCENPAYTRFAALPEQARAALTEADAVPTREGLKLTMPDGSEWFIEDASLDYVLPAVKESRAYFAEQAAG